MLFQYAFLCRPRDLYHHPHKTGRTRDQFIQWKHVMGEAKPELNICGHALMRHLSDTRETRDRFHLSFDTLLFPISISRFPNLPQVRVLTEKTKIAKSITWENIAISVMHEIGGLGRLASKLWKCLLRVAALDNWRVIDGNASATAHWSRREWHDSGVGSLDVCDRWVAERR